MKITEEILKELKAAKNVEEIISICKNKGIETTEEKIKTLFEKMHKKCELSDDELDDVSGGFYGEFVGTVPDSRFLNKYVYIPTMRQCGQIIEVRRYEDILSGWFEYVIRLNKGGEVTFDLANNFELLPDGVTDIQYSPDGHGFGMTF